MVTEKMSKFFSIHALWHYMRRLDILFIDIKPEDMTIGFVGDRADVIVLVDLIFELFLIEIQGLLFAIRSHHSRDDGVSVGSLQKSFVGGVMAPASFLSGDSVIQVFFKHISLSFDHTESRGRGSKSVHQGFDLAPVLSVLKGHAGVRFVQPSLDLSNVM